MCNRDYLSNPTSTLPTPLKMSSSLEWTVGLPLEINLACAFLNFSGVVDETRVLPRRKDHQTTLNSIKV